MAIESYADLKTELADRFDVESGDIDADTAIDLAEARINRELRSTGMEAAFDETIASGVIAVPTGFLEWKTCYVNSSPITVLESESAQSIYRYWPTRSSDSKPQAIAQEAGNFIFGPYPDSTYNIKGTYYKKFTALSDSNTTNWLITDAVDLIFYGALVEAAEHLADTNRSGLYESRFQSALRLYNQAEQTENFARAMPMYTRLA
jgi:hypothetical protein